jgi:hypothetical protein
MPRGKRRSASPELRPVEASNDLDDEAKARLLLQGLESLEALIEKKDSVVATIRSQRKTLKSEGFSREEVDYGLWLRKWGEAGGEMARDRLAMQLRIAAWLGKPLGYQPSLDLEAAQ